MYQIVDTIVAQATPLGNGGVGVIRISGPQTREILEKLFSRHEAALSQPRTMIYGSLHTVEGDPLDKPLAVWMPGPASYTGEDTVELHCHGGMYLLRQIVAACVAAGARPAEAGEFTLRAFLNGRMDLSQAEAVADLISSRTLGSAAQALQQLDGILSRPLAEIEQELVDLQAQITVAIDFPEDAEAPEYGYLISVLRRQLAALDDLMAGAKQGLLRREGAALVLTGQVNAGKSSLLNALIGRDRAIVTSEPGATRDVIEETLDIGGIPVLLSDTAGFRENNGLSRAELLGQERSQAALETADLILAVIDLTQPVMPQLPDRPCLIVANKCDVAQDMDYLRLEGLLEGDQVYYPVSALTGEGLAELREAVSEILGVSEARPKVTNIRHLNLLAQAHDSLESAIVSISCQMPLDMITIDLDNARSYLGEISGRTASEELLANIFSRFCVGK